ncbi:hypothetical protein [Paenibacillus chitinolyticus]|uniref:hypothetical protein n=1 Tax=Paenibacillus chitinolyticus TaxID=79263 RepID=UPI003672C2E6
MKKTIVSLTAFALLTSAAPAFAQDNNQVSNTTANKEFSPMAAQMSYSFWDLYHTSHIDTKDTFKVDASGTVSLTLVQYPNNNGNGTANLNYGIINLDGKQVGSTINVDKNYTSTNTTIYWYNIPKGTYKIRISNPYGGVDAMGNGYIN